MKTTRVLYFLVATLFLLSVVYAGQFAVARLGDYPEEMDAAGTGNHFFKTYEVTPTAAQSGDVANYGEVTSDGGYILTGEISDVTVTYWSDLLVLKLSKNGAIQWHRTYGLSSANAEDRGNCIRETADGGYIVVGKTQVKDESSGIFNTELLALKLFTDGSVDWQKRYGNSDVGMQEQAYSAVQADDGGYVVVGVGPPEPGMKDSLILVKLNATGEVESQKAYGKYNWWEDRLATAYAIQKTDDSGYIVAGFREFPETWADMWVLKLNSDLSVAWQKRYGGKNWDGANSIRQTTDGGYIVAGQTGSWGAGYQDVWVLKLDSDGDIIWQKAFGGVYSDRATSVWQTGDGGYLVAGHRRFSSSTEDDTWVLKLNSDGSLAWHRHWGGPAYESAFSAREQDGDYVIIGSGGMGVWGAYAWVTRLDDNGTIPNCNDIKTSELTITDTDAVAVGTDEKTHQLNLAASDAGLSEPDTQMVSKFVCKGTWLPNLTVHLPQGWSDKIVVSRVQGTHTDDTALSTTDDLYVDWAMWNEGPGDTETWAAIDLYVDGVYRTSWQTPDVMPAETTKEWSDYAIGKLGPGTHQIKLVLDNPSRVTETDESDNEYIKTITISQATGSLKVNIAPAGAVTAGAKWSVDGTTWKNSGDTLTLPVGSYTVTFNNVTGWNTPASQSATIANGQTTTITGTYNQQTGTLKVNIAPAGAVTAGAKWSVDGTTWKNSGDTLSLPVGSYTVTFSNVTGWNTPDSQSATINNGQTTTITGTYNQQTGTLKVNISPAGAVTAGAKWSVDGTTWKSSGDTLSLPVGSYTVAFSNVTGWNTPASQSATITNGQTTTITGTYVQQTGTLKVNITPTGAVNAGAGWSVDGSAWKNSGDSLTLPVGSYSVTFKSVAGWTTPSPQGATITNGQTTTITGTYTQLWFPNLTPYKPSGWTDKILVAKTKGSIADDTPLYSSDELYVDFAVINNGQMSTLNPFYVALFVDGAKRDEWNIAALPAGQHHTSLDYSIGKLKPGSHQIKIVADNWAAIDESDEGDNAYTKTITVGLGAATLISPSGQISTNKPTYTWNAVPGSTWYYLWVEDSKGTAIKKWYSADQAGCYIGSDICSVTPETAVAPGSAKWWIQTWGANIDGPWSDGMAFTVPAPPLPGKVTLISPSGEISTNTPAYVWTADPLATWYLLWVNDSTGNKIGTWITPEQAGCSSGTGTCTVSPGTVLAPGSGTWWVQTYGSNGYGPWSDGMAFTVPAPRLPGKVTLISPSGVISTNTPGYTWYADPKATSYCLYVNDSTGNKINIWYSAVQAGCYGGTGTCSVAPGIALATGSGTWWVQTWNDNGYGPWSDSLSFSVQGGGMPNLHPYKHSDWPDAILVYPKEGSSIGDSSLYASDELYVDLAIANSGKESASEFYVALYVDDVLQKSWLKSSEAKPGWYYWWKYVGIGPWSAGTHTIKVVVDTENSVAESNESDNTYERTFQIVANVNVDPGSSFPSALKLVDAIEAGEAPIE